jgi:predicted small secreted protein
VTGCAKEEFLAKPKIKGNDMKKFTLLSLLALILMTSLLGCNAFRGAGKDIESAGQHIENIGN